MGRVEKMVGGPLLASAKLLMIPHILIHHVQLINTSVVSSLRVSLKGAFEMAQWRKARVSTSDNLSSSPRIHRMRGKTQLQKLSSNLYIHCPPLTHKHTELMN